MPRATQLAWRYRVSPGPTPAHLWPPASPNSLCGLASHGSGDWKPETTRKGRCGLCERKRARYYPETPCEGAED